MPQAGAVQGAVQRLRAGGAATPAGTSAAAAATATLVTGTGFYAGERAAVRELARLAGVQYSGDLVQSRTTHLVLAPSASGVASHKLQKAAEWGIPVLRLQWLLDSVAAGALQPTGPYLVDFDEVDEEAAAAPIDGDGAAQPPGSCHELPARHRPSSVASNPLQLGGAQQGGAQQGGGALQAAAAMVPARGCASGCKPAATSQQEAAQHGRAALAPVANRLADQLRRMSIAPDALPAQQQQECQQQLQWDDRHQAQQQQQAQHQHQQPRHPQPSDSPPQQRSPLGSMGSPQHSLSLQGMVAADAALASPAEVGSAAAAAPSGLRGTEQASPDTDGGEELEQGWSPMQESSADSPQQQQQSGSQQQLQQRLGSQQQDQAAGRRTHPSPGRAASSFTFSLAAALGRSVSEDPAYGSPMASSPAAPGLGMQAAGVASAGRSAAGGSRLHSASPASPAPSSMACTSAGAGSQGDPLATLPTPACIRDWSDDDSSLGGSPLADAGMQPAAHGDGTGPTQTPPAVRQAIAAAMGPTQLPPAQQQSCSQQQQLGLDVAGEVSDDETVASEPPAAGDLVVSDSGSDSEDAPADEPQHLGQQHASAAPGPGAMQPRSQQQQQWSAAPQQTAAPQLPTAQKRRGLLQISRVGQPLAANSRWQAAAAGQVGAKATTPQDGRPAAGTTTEPAAAAFSGGHGQQPSPHVAPQLSGQHSHMCSQGDVSPASVASAGNCPALAPAGQHDEQGPAASSSSAGPAVDEHFVTSRRAGRGASRRQPTAAAARRSVREWSESDSSGEEFPTPTGQRSGKGGLGLTGLTQLDPASIVIARPKPAGSALLRGGGADNQSGVVVGLKFLQRPPRGSAVREHHGLPNLKTVQFAEQVQVTPLSLLLSTKDKKTAVRLRPGGLLSRTEEEAEDDEFQPSSSSARSRGRRSSASSSARTGGAPAGAAASTAESGSRGQQQQEQQEEQEEEPVLGEPQTFYRLADGSWHLELCRFYTAAQAEVAAAAAGRALVLPQGFDRSCELLKAVEREHAPMSDIAGGIQIRRVKQGGSMLRLKGGTASRASRSYYWRLALDTASWRVVTDRAAADFVAVE